MAFPKLVLKGYAKFTELHDIEELYTWLLQSNERTLDAVQKQSLAMLLLSDCYLTHSDRKIRLLTSSCLAQLLRLCIPIQPFTNVEHLETTLLFICGQLAQALQSASREERRLVAKLLECVISIKIFRLCSLISKGQQLLTSLLSLMLPIAEAALAEEQTLVVQLIRSIVDDPLTMSDCKVLMPLAETIVMGSNSSVARALVASSMDKYSGQMMSELLVWLIERCECKEKGEEMIPSSLQGLGMFRLAWELHLMSLQLVLPAYNVFATKLKSLDVSVRVESLKIVKHIIVKDVVSKEHSLFTHFLDRFSDTNLGVRVYCVQTAWHVSQVHPHLVPEMLEALHQRTKDTELSVRSEVGAVCTLIMLSNPDIQELLLILIKLASDKDCQVSSEAVKGICRVYKQHLSNHAALTPSQRDAAHSIFNCVMGHYFSVETALSRVVTERLMASFLLPDSMHVTDRAEKLLFFLTEANPVTIRTYHAMLKDQINRRAAVMQWLQQDAATQRQEIETSVELCSCLPQIEDRMWVLNALVTGSEYDRNLMPSLIVLLRDNEMSQVDMDIIAEHAINTISLMYSGVPIHICKLRRFILSLYKGMLNKHFLQILMQLVHTCMVSPLQAVKFGLDPSTVRMQTSNVAKAICVEAYSHVVYSTEILQPIISIIGIDSECAAAAFHFLATLAESKSFGMINPELAHKLMEMCEECLFKMPHRKLTMNLVKAIVHFIHSSVTPQLHAAINNIFQLLRVELDAPDLRQRAPYLVLLGHLSGWLPVEQRGALKAVMARKVVKDMLMKSCTIRTEIVVHYKFWCPDVQMSTAVLCKVQGMRAMSRWITQAQSDDVTISNTLRMMDAFITHKGDLLDEKTLSDKERAVLRLEAGACILKICRIQGAFEYLTANQIHNLSSLIMDEDVTVRAQFTHKVNKGLSHALPAMFVSFLALGVLEPEQHLQSKVVTYIESFFYSPATSSSWPQYCLYWALPLLACTPCRWLLPSQDNVTGAWPIQSGIAAFSRIRVALWSLLRPIIALQPHVSVARLERIVQAVKNCKDTVLADTYSNQRLWSTCDVALNLLDVYKMTSLRKSSKTPDVMQLDVRPQDCNLLCAHLDPNHVNTTNFANVVFGPLPPVNHAPPRCPDSPACEELDPIFKCAT